MDEFDWIALVRPLTRANPAALDLRDDAAGLIPLPGQTLVLTHDTLVEGVHFLPGTPMADVARKLLRVNLSDLAAKGAQPLGYLLSVAWPETASAADRVEFAKGLGMDGEQFGLDLLGGDTVSTSGPLVIGATLIGTCPVGTMVLRSGARAQDLLFVSGCIGEGWLGLQDARSGTDSQQARHYRLPQPHLMAREALRACATAAADVSDGLLADAANIGLASGLGVEIQLELVPLSTAGRAVVQAAGRAEGRARLLDLCSGGDDYVIVGAVAPQDAESLIAAMAAEGLEATICGRFVPLPGLVVLDRGQPVAVGKTGWRHTSSDQ